MAHVKRRVPVTVRSRGDQRLKTSDLHIITRKKRIWIEMFRKVTFRTNQHYGSKADRIWSLKLAQSTRLPFTKSSSDTINIVKDLGGLCTTKLIGQPFIDRPTSPFLHWHAHSLTKITITYTWRLSYITRKGKRIWDPQEFGLWPIY